MKANPLHIDPSRTSMIRRAFIAETKQRMAELRKAIWQLIVVEDAFGLADKQQSTIKTLLNTNAQDYKFLTDDKKLEAFAEWLDGQVKGKVLSLGKGGSPWTAKYVESAYRQGIVRAYTDTNQRKMKKPIAGLTGTRQDFINSSFNAPEALAKVRLLATRSFEAMKGVTDAQKTQMNRILADGMAHGRGPAKIARDMVDRIDTLTRSRALTIARTEVINAHTEGQLDTFEALGVKELGVFAEWLTAGDDRVCPQCQSLEGKVYNMKEARGLIPAHPNCRCCWIPSFDQLTKKKKGAGSKPVAKKVSAVEAAAAQDRFGHREGSQAALINSALGEGASIEEMMAATGLSKERIASHMRHLSGRNIVVYAGGRFEVVLPPTAPPPPRVPTAPTGIKPPTLTTPVPVAPPPALSLTIPPLPVPAPPSAVAPTSGARYAKAEEYRQEILKLKERSMAMLAAKEPEIAAIEAEMVALTGQSAALSKNPIFDRYWKLSPEERESIKAEYYTARDAQEALYRKQDALTAKMSAIRKETKVSVQEARDLLREERSLQVAVEFQSLSLKKSGYEDRAKEVLSWMPADGFSAAQKKMIGYLEVTTASEKGVNGTYSALNNHIKLAAKKVSVSSSSTFVHEFGHHLSYKLPDFMKAQNDFFRKRTSGESEVQLPGYASHIKGKRDDFGKVNVYAGRIYEDGRFPEIASVGLQALWEDPVKFAQTDPEWFNMIISQLKKIP